MDRSHDSQSPNSESASWLNDELCRRQDLGERERTIVGSLLGTAVGDAIGQPYEGLSPRRARRLLGSPDGHRFLFGHGMVSDDTEHTCVVAQSLVVARDEVDFARELARRLRNWVRLVPAGVGWATLRACVKLNLGFSAEASGVYSAGNGAAMRTAILGAAVDELTRLRKLVAISTRITHTDPRAEHGALAIALAARITRINQRISPSQFVGVLATMISGPESQELFASLYRAAASVARNEATIDFACSMGLKRGVTGYINHTVPIVLHATWTHPTDFRAAVQAVVSCGGDADTTAAIVGGILGARVGKEGIPTEWLHGLRDWPRSVDWMEQLGRCLAHAGEAEPMGMSMHLSSLSLLSRNLFFAGVVLFHGFRRMLPPY